MAFASSARAPKPTISPRRHSSDANGNGHVGFKYVVKLPPSTKVKESFELDGLLDRDLQDDR